MDDAPVGQSMVGDDAVEIYEKLRKDMDGTMACLEG